MISDISSPSPQMTESATQVKDSDMVSIAPIKNAVNLTSPVDYSTIPYNQLPDPGVAFNEWPNAPYNTVRYDWHAEYPVCSPEWFAQHSAKNALKCGIQYGTRDRAQEQRDNLEAYLIARGDRLPTPEKEVPAMQQTGLADSKNGILTDSHLYRYIGGRIVKMPIDGNSIRNVCDMLQIAINYNLRTVWVMAGTELSKLATADFIQVSGDWQFKGNPQMTTGTKKHIPHCKFVAGYQEGLRTAYVGFLEYNTDWGLKKVVDPVVALATLSYIEDALGIAVLYSAGKCGVYLMEKANKKKRVDWIEKIDIRGIAPLQERNVCVVALDWKGALTEEDTGFVVAFDKTMTYPASCTSALLGTGNPVYEKSPQFDQKKIKPGIWHCRISGTSEFDGVTLPHPTDGKTEGWFYTYTAKLLLEVGYQVEILEAWIWHEAHTILRPYAEKLFQGREVLDDSLAPDTTRYKNAQARKIAAADIKFIAVKSLGWTGMRDGMDNTNEELDWYIRPDWDDLVIDNARYQMFWRIRKCIEKGYYPVGVHNDCLYFISPTPDHEQALPALDKPMMERAKKLGGYKQHYKTVLTLEEVRPIFARNKAMSAINTELLDLDKKHLEGGQ